MLKIIIVVSLFCQTALGTNPLSFAAPGKDGDNFFLDMATTAVSHGKVHIYSMNGQGSSAVWPLSFATWLFALARETVAIYC